MVRFIENLKAKKKKQPINCSEVSAKEMFAAEKYWVLDVQSTLRKEPKFNQLKQNLGLFEEEQVLRCKGRLNYSDLEFDGKFPIKSIYRVGSFCLSSKSVLQWSEINSCRTSITLLGSTR